jgi:ABC-type transport system involved in multi-copper enzyme maturation permease subunit
MPVIRQDIATWLWRLLPGNPIFLRVLYAGGRRIRHLWIRLGYLGVLFLVMFIAMFGSSTGGALDDLAKGSTQVFRFISIVQLAMICFLAPVFMAAAITQEKDSQTYNILLSTPLSNAQIVLGSLLSRLFFVMVLLLAGVPILCVTMIYGGVTLRQILLSTGIAATSAVLTGSLAIAISAARVGTRKTIFSFYLTIALYLLAVGGMGYPRAFRRPAETLRYLERNRAVEEWVTAGNTRPPAFKMERLLTLEPEKMDIIALRGIVTDPGAAETLLDKLRQADDVAAERLDTNLTFFGCPGAPLNTDGVRMSWLAPFHPLLALQVALNEVEAPPAATGLGWPMDYFLSKPYYGYMTLTLLTAMSVVVFSMIYVRRGAREGETGRLGWALGQLLQRLGLQAKRRKPRRVWQNPVAWREARTRASFAGRGALRYILVVLGLTCGAVLLISYVGGWGWFDPSELRLWLSGLIVIEFALILLMAANSAATAITREREANTMELLLCTPLTSGYIIYGKLRGLVSFLFPLILVPAVCLLGFAVYDLALGHERPIVWIESGFELVLLLVVYSSFACMLGLQMSLRFRRTVQAVLSSVAILMAVSFALGACGYGLIEVSEVFGAFIAPFTPFTAVSAIVNPAWMLSRKAPDADLTQIRMLVPIGVCTAAVFYTLVVVGMYRGMIRNFDMTLRKQSA